MPDHAISFLVIIGVEFILSERIAAAGTEVIILTEAVNLHYHALENRVRVETNAPVAATFFAIDETLRDAIFLEALEAL